MAIISEVKCSRCDHRYSSIRMRCPYCGARRFGSGKSSGDQGSGMAKLIIGILLLAILIIAVVVLLINALSAEPTDTEDGGQQGEDYTGDEGVNSVDGTPLTPPDLSGGQDGGEDGETGDDPDGGEGVTPPSTVDSVIMTYRGNEIRYEHSTYDYEISINVGESITFGYKTVPADTSAEPVWSVEDEDIGVILQTGEFTALKAGYTVVTLEIGGIDSTCYIRVR